MEKALTIKPHHLLDIIRDFGAGVSHQPHPYGHDVHRLARIIRQNPHTLFELTAEADSICTPCRHLVEGRCRDTTTSPGHEVSKDSWNRLIDGRIFARLGLQPGDRVSALQLCLLARDRLGDLYSLYAEVERSLTARREQNLSRGLRDYIASAGPGSQQSDNT